MWLQKLFKTVFQKKIERKFQNRMLFQIKYLKGLT